MQNDDVIRLVFSVLAVYRVAHMLVFESGPARMFERWRGYWIERYPGWIAEGMTCILCMSFWLGWLTLLPIPTPILFALSVSALTVLWEAAHD